MESLPSEIIWHITTFLEPLEIVRLQHVCRRLLSIARDGNLWRNECFEQSSFLKDFRTHQELIANTPAREPRFQDLRRALNSVQLSKTDGKLHKGLEDLQARTKERIRIQANWDPSYPNEKINWYSEFIHRAAPITISWLQQPRRREDIANESLEVRGIGIYYPPGNMDASLAVAPLDDGSVCLWDLTGSAGKKGGIIGRSRPGILSLPTLSDSDNMRRSNMISTGVTECVSIDSQNQKAYIAVQGDLVEVDLTTLTAVSREQFPFSISALSEAKDSVPITVGTNLSLHMYDARANRRHPQDDQAAEQLEPVVENGKTSFYNISKPLPDPNYAPLFHPGPLSILHLPSHGDEWDGNGDIYVAGRFSSILNYDRRYFPRLRGTIYSGASLCSLASIPYQFAARERDLMRHGELSIEEVKSTKALPGNTLIACGEYNTKGSLELYGQAPLPHLPNTSSESSSNFPKMAEIKNRQTSSRSKLLSVTCHGTRIVFSDGNGNVKWVERDGITEVRHWNIGHGYMEAPRGIFGTLGDSYMDSGSGDIVRKILHTSTGSSDRHVNQQDLVLWTGEKVGLLNFSNKAGFTSADFEETGKALEETHREREERVYAETMRRALQRQADEVRFVRGLGLGLMPGV